MKIFLTNSPDASLRSLISKKEIVLVKLPLITLFSHFNSGWGAKAFLEAGQLLESKPALLNSYLEERLCQKEFIPVIKY